MRPWGRQKRRGAVLGGYDAVSPARLGERRAGGRGRPEGSGGPKGRRGRGEAGGGAAPRERCVRGGGRLVERFLGAGAGETGSEGGNGRRTVGGGGSSAAAPRGRAGGGGGRRTTTPGSPRGARSPAPSGPCSQPRSRAEPPRPGPVTALGAARGVGRASSVGCRSWPRSLRCSRCREAARGGGVGSHGSGALSSLLQGFESGGCGPAR